MRRYLFLLLFSVCVQAHAESAQIVPAGLLQIPAGVAHILVADTATATLRSFAANDNGLVQTDARYMSIGRNGIGKERAWDRKTPLGIYFITEELDTTRLHDKYGDKAFALDYPNAWDRYRERTGDGIWLHGVDRNAPDRPPLDTDGCLAIPNADIQEMAGDLEPLVTPVIVMREFAWQSAEKAAAQRQQLAGALARWETSIEQNDFSAYLALYADNFRYRGMNRQDWAEWRGQVFLKRTPVRLEIEDLLLIADPEEPGLYLSRFTQRVQSVDSTVVTQKRLYWRHDDAGELRIITEDNG